MFNFCAANLEERQEWMDAFRHAMNPIEQVDEIQDVQRRMSLLSNVAT